MLDCSSRIFNKFNLFEHNLFAINIIVYYFVSKQCSLLSLSNTEGIKMDTLDGIVTPTPSQEFKVSEERTANNLSDLKHIAVVS